MHEDARMYDGGDRPRLGQGRGSREGRVIEPTGRVMMTEEELEVEERMDGRRLVLDCTSPSSGVFCVREGERSRRGE